MDVALCAAEPAGDIDLINSFGDDLVHETGFVETVLPAHFRERSPPTSLVTRTTGSDRAMAQPTYQRQWLSLVLQTSGCSARWSGNQQDKVPRHQSPEVLVVGSAGHELSASQGHVSPDAARCGLSSHCQMPRQWRYRPAARQTLRPLLCKSALPRPSSASYQ